MAPTQPNEVRRDAVIEAATELFWRNGYDDVSIGDIVEATGLNRYALYRDFGGKKEIFMATLEAYIATARELIGEVLSGPPRDPYECMREILVTKMLDPDMFPAGCLICTTAVDVAAKDEDVAALMASCNTELSAQFIQAYERAQEIGLADPKGDPAAFAELAHALYFSTGVQARMGRSREELMHSLDTLVNGLRYKTDT